MRPSDESSLPRQRQFCFYDELALLLVLNGTKGQDRSGTFGFYITFNVQSSSLSGKYIWNFLFLLPLNSLNNKEFEITVQCLSWKFEIPKKLRKQFCITSIIGYPKNHMSFSLIQLMVEIKLALEKSLQWGKMCGFRLFFFKGLKTENTSCNHRSEQSEVVLSIELRHVHAKMRENQSRRLAINREIARWTPHADIQPRPQFGMGSPLKYLLETSFLFRVYPGDELWWENRDQAQEEF